MPASDGTAGQYLKTDGSGNLTWATVTSNFVIGDGSTTDTVNGGETLTFTGGTGIDATVTANTVTIDLNTNTDGVAEGSSNLYHTTARAISAIEGAAHLTIDGGTLYVDTSNNYVGIGDTSPSYPLDVAGAIGVNGSQVISSGGVITGAVADSALTIGGSLAGVLSNLKVQYGTAYSGTPIQGSFFFDSLNQKLKVYTGSAFVDAVPAGSGGGGGGGATDANTTFRNYSYTLTGTTSAISGIDDNEITAGAFIIGHKYTITTAGNTDFTTIGAADSNVNTVFTATGVGTGTGTATQTLFYDTTSSTTRVVAYVNGIKQVYGSGRDFVATTGTSVAFTYNLGAGDTVDLQVYELLTNAAYYLKSEVYTQTQVNSQISTGVSAYLPLAGGTLTGGLNVSSGNVGIGTSSPNTKLHVNSSNGSTYPTLGTASGSLGLAIGELHGMYLGVDGPSGNGWVQAMREDGTGTSYNLVLQPSGGNVGIGTSSPATKLQVNFGDSAGNLVNLVGDGATAGSAIATNWNTGGSYFDIRLGGTTSAYTKLRIDSSGNVGIGTTSPDLRLDVTRSGDGDIAVFQTTGNHGVVLSAPSSTTLQIASKQGSKNLDLWANTLSFSAGSAERMRIDSSGNVGIGTTATALFNSVGGSTKLAVTGSSASTDVLGNTDASIAIINTDTTANNTAGLHFARADTDDTPNYAGASIVTQFHDTQVTGQYPKASMNFLTSTAANTAPSLKMTIDSSGKVGIGKVPTQKFEVEGGRSIFTDSNNFYSLGVKFKAGNYPMYIGATDSLLTPSLQFSAATGAPLMHLTYVGNLGIGVVPESSYPDRPVVRVGSGLGLMCRKTGNPSHTWINTNAYQDPSTADDKYIGTDEASQIKQVNGAFNFNVAASGAADSVISWNTAMTINNSGDIYTGTSSLPADDNVVGVAAYRDGLFSISRASAYVLNVNVKGTTGPLIVLRKDASVVGTISTNGTSTAYNTSSDYRLKTDAQPMVGASDRVLALKPVNFEWIADGSRVDGFLAHEAQEVVPECVTGTKDAMRDEEYEVTAAIEATYDEDGNELTAAVEAVMGTRSVPDMQGIDQSKLVPLLTAALQEAITKIQVLEARLTTAGIE
jgi:hypothetical protein